MAARAVKDRMECPRCRKLELRTYSAIDKRVGDLGEVIYTIRCPGCKMLYELRRFESVAPLEEDLSEALRKAFRRLYGIGEVGKNG